MAKRNKLVLDAQKAAISDRKAILDAELAANLISQAEHDAQVVDLQKKGAEAEIAEIIRQQEVRVDAYIEANNAITEAQLRFNALNAGNAAAIKKNDAQIAIARANAANKYVTDYLTSERAVATIREKLATDTRRAEIKHQEDLQKIRQEGLDWLDSETALREKNARAAANASAVRTANPLQGVILEAEYTEFERLTANANKYDAEIKKLQKSVDEYNEAEALRIALGGQETALDVERFKENDKALERLDRLKKYKADLEDGISVQVKVKGAEAASIFIEKEAVRLRDGLTDAIISAGKDGGEGLRKFLQEELLAKPFRMEIQALVQPIAQGMSNLIWGGGTGSAAGNILSSFSGASGTGGVLGTLSTAMQGATLAASTFGTNLLGTAKAVSLSGASLSSAMSAGASLFAEGQFAAGSGMLAGAALPYAAGAVAIGKLVDSLSSIGSVSYRGSDLVGRATGAGAFSGSVRSDFEQKDGGWGWVTGSSHMNAEWKKLDPAVAQYMSAVNESVVGSVKNLAKSLGLSVDAVDNFSKQIEFKLDGLDAQGLKSAIDKAFSGMADDISNFAWGDFLLPLSQDGETLAATLQRLNTDLLTVNNLLAVFGKPLFEATPKGVQDMERFVASLGGLSKFTELSNTLLTVNDVLRSFNLTLYDISVEGAQAAKALVDSVGVAVNIGEEVNDGNRPILVTGQGYRKETDWGDLASGLTAVGAFGAWVMLTEHLTNFSFAKTCR
jgi:hypothetical protein